MIKTRRNVSVTLSVILAVLMLVVSACGNNNNAAKPKEAANTNKPAENKKLKIGMTLGSLSHPFFLAMAKGAEASAEEHNAEVITVSADYDLAKQTTQIEDFITKKVDLILLNAVDSKGIAGAVAQIKAAGIPVVAIDVGAEGGVDATVTSDNYLAGKLVGEYLVKRLGGKGNIAVVTGPPVTAVTDRIAGFEDALKNTNIKVIAKQNGEGSKEKSVTIMENILQANPPGSIQAVFGINDPTGIGIKLAAEQSQRDKELFIVGVDGDPEGAAALKEKKSYAATSAQNPFEMVKTAIEIGLKIKNGEQVEDITKVPVDLITQDNVSNYNGW